MKLLVYEKFFEAYSACPKEIQKKTLSFQRKFRQDSTMTSIHLEPISEFKDSSLRTARIDQAYRIIIKAPETGDAYYLLWIDKHDLAMSWAKSKVFHWNHHTSSMQVFEMSDQDIATKSESLEKSRFFSSFSNEELVKIGVPEFLLPAVKTIDTIDDLEKSEKFLSADLFENLFFLLDGGAYNELIEQVEIGKLSEQDEIDQNLSKNNQRSFIELTDDEIFNEAITGTLQKWRYYLHPSQRELVYGNFKGPVKVSGAAGTGKTIAAIHRLKYLVESVSPGKAILFTTFTKALTTNLKLMVKDFIPENINYTISNIDSIAIILAKKEGIISQNDRIFNWYAGDKGPEDIWTRILQEEIVPYDREFLQREYEDIILAENIHSREEYFRVSRTGRGKALTRRQRSEIWEYIQSFIELKKRERLYYKEEIYNTLADYMNKLQNPPYAHIIADELQDLGNPELRLLRSMVADSPNNLFFVGDPLQQIYPKKINFSRIGINVRGKRSRRLRINYRTSEEIRKAAVAIIDGIEFDDFNGDFESKSGYHSLFHGEAPSYMLYKNRNIEIEELLKDINNLARLDYSYSSIAVACRTNAALKEIQNAMHIADIPYRMLSGEKVKGHVDGVNLVTFHSIKGLEFKQLFICGVEKQTIPLLPVDFPYFSEDDQKKHLQMERSLLYVAMTRAIEKVKISGIGQKCEFVEF
jgi:hypothetical protein